MKNIIYSNVKIYRNLRKKCFSIMDKKVVGYGTQLLMENCRFIVRESGRQKVISEKRKNVHAFMRGDIISCSNMDETKYDEISYNPYESGYFYLVKNKQPIMQAKRVLAKNNKLYLVER